MFTVLKFKHICIYSVIFDKHVKLLLNLVTNKLVCYLINNKLTKLVHMKVSKVTSLAIFRLVKCNTQQYNNKRKFSDITEY